MYCCFLALAFKACNFGNREPSRDQLNNSVISGGKAKAAEKKTSEKVVIRTQDDMFKDVPDTLSSGNTTFKVDNKGRYPHNDGLLKQFSVKEYKTES